MTLILQRETMEPPATGGEYRTKKTFEKIVKGRNGQAVERRRGMGRKNIDYRGVVLI